MNALIEKNTDLEEIIGTIEMPEIEHAVTNTLRQTFNCYHNLCHGNLCKIELLLQHDQKLFWQKHSAFIASILEDIMQNDARRYLGTPRIHIYT
jgi:lantibiotic modifying enzyme